MMRKILTSILGILASLSLALGIGGLKAGAKTLPKADTVSEVTEEDFVVKQDMTKSKTENGVLLSGEGGGYFVRPMNASGQIDVEAEFVYHSSGDCWATVCFYSEPAGGHVGREPASGIVVMLRNSGGRLNFNLYKNTPTGFSILRENFPSTAAVGERNTISLVRIGSRYVICVNGMEIPGYKELISEYFSRNEFLTADGKTYVAFGSYQGVEVTVGRVSNPETEINASTWKYEEGVFEESDDGIVIQTPSALNTIARDGNYVEWKLMPGSFIARGGAMWLGLQKTKAEEIGGNLSLKIEDGGNISVYLKGEVVERAETGLSVADISSLAIRNFNDCYRLEINGRGVCYLPFVLTDFAKSKSKPEVYASLKTEGEGTKVALKYIDSSDGAFDKASEFDIRNWKDFRTAVEEYDDKIVLTASTWCSVKLSAIKEQVDFSVDWFSTQNLTFALAASGFEPKAGSGGAKGALFAFNRLSDGIYLDAFLVSANDSKQVLSSYKTDVKDIFSVTFKKMIGGGMVLMIDDERVLAGGKDPFGIYTVSDVANTAGYNVLSVAVEEGARVTLLGAKSRLFDSSPVLGEGGLLVGEEGLGMNPDEWKTTDGDSAKTDGIYVNEKGGLNLCYYPPSGSVYYNTLTTPLDADYVDFTVDIENFVDSVQQDAWISFAFGTSPDSRLAVADPNVYVSADCVVFMMKNVGGILYLGIYQRYDGKFTQLQGLTAAMDTATGVYRFGMVYYNYEMSLLINGKKYLDPDGNNPLKDVCRVNYSEDGKTYFATAFFSGGADAKGKDARSVVLYGMNNVGDENVYRLLDELNFEIYTHKFEEISEEYVSDRKAVYISLAIAAGILAAGGTAVAVWMLRIKKRER